MALSLNLKTIAFVSIGVVFLGLVLFQPRTDITVKNDSAANILNKDSQKTGKQSSLLSGLFSSDAQDNRTSSPDIASQILLDQPDSQERKEMIRYINTADAAVPLTQDALRFALAQAILGQTSELQDSILRLQEGQTGLSALNPPLDAVVFHKISISLLGEYQKLFTVILSIPREKFDASQLEDDFKRLDMLVTIGKRELQFLSSKYTAGLSAKSISFYEDVIGVRTRSSL